MQVLTRNSLNKLIKDDMCRIHNSIISESMGRNSDDEAINRECISLLSLEKSYCSGVSFQFKGKICEINACNTAVSEIVFSGSNFEANFVECECRLLSFSGRSISKLYVNRCPRFHIVLKQVQKVRDCTISECESIDVIAVECELHSLIMDSAAQFNATRARLVLSDATVSKSHFTRIRFTNCRLDCKCIRDCTFVDCVFESDSPISGVIMRRCKFLDSCGYVFDNIRMIDCELPQPRSWWSYGILAIFSVLYIIVSTFSKYALRRKAITIPKLPKHVYTDPWTYLHFFYTGQKSLRYLFSTLLFALPYIVHLLLFAVHLGLSQITGVIIYPIAASAYDKIDEARDAIASCSNIQSSSSVLREIAKSVVRYKFIYGIDMTDDLEMISSNINIIRVCEAAGIVLPPVSAMVCNSIAKYQTLEYCDRVKYMIDKIVLRYTKKSTVLGAVWFQAGKYHAIALGILIIYYVLNYYLVLSVSGLKSVELQTRRTPAYKDYAMLIYMSSTATILYPVLFLKMILDACHIVAMQLPLLP